MSYARKSKIDYSAAAAVCQPCIFQNSSPAAGPPQCPRRPPLGKNSPARESHRPADRAPALPRSASLRPEIPRPAPLHPVRFLSWRPPARR